MADTELYDLLEVGQNASDADIKKVSIITFIAINIHTIVLHTHSPPPHTHTHTHTHTHLPPPPTHTHTCRTHWHITHTPHTPELPQASEAVPSRQEPGSRGQVQGDPECLRGTL